MQQQFMDADLNNDNVLTKQEVTRLLQGMGYSIDEEYAAEAIKTFDTDGSGDISLAEFPEFLALFKGDEAVEEEEPARVRMRTQGGTTREGVLEPARVRMRTQGGTLREGVAVADEEEEEEPGKAAKTTGTAETSTPNALGAAASDVDAARRKLQTETIKTSIGLSLSTSARFASKLAAAAKTARTSSGPPGGRGPPPDDGFGGPPKNGRQRAKAVAVTSTTAATANDDLPPGAPPPETAEDKARRTAAGTTNPAAAPEPAPTVEVSPATKARFAGFDTNEDSILDAPEVASMLSAMGYACTEEYVVSGNVQPVAGSAGSTSVQNSKIQRAGQTSLANSIS